MTTVVRDQIFPQKPPGSRFDSRAQGFSPPLARQRSSFSPPSPNLLYIIGHKLHRQYPIGAGIDIDIVVQAVVVPVCIYLSSTRKFSMSIQVTQGKVANRGANITRGRANVRGDAEGSPGDGQLESAGR